MFHVQNYYVRYEEKCNCRHRYSIAKMNRKLYNEGEMDGAKEKDDRMASAFTASLQIEFEDEADKIIFESEHLLSKKPMQIDELVIKVHDNEKIQKNIGRIFRKHNIVEYKSPEDYLTINDFYKVYGYCCFYQSDTEHVCEIPTGRRTFI